MQPELVCLNGRILPLAEARISVADRGFRYGDGAFETIRIVNGAPFQLDHHLSRLRSTLTFLGIQLTQDVDLERSIHEFIHTTNSNHAILRLQVTRGDSGSGLTAAPDAHPTCVMTLRAPPALADEKLILHVASMRVSPSDALLQHKTCNKLAYLLAQTEAVRAGANEALFLNTNGHVTECATSNCFWVSNETVYTAPVSAGLLPGITRRLILEICRARRIPSEEKLAGQTEVSQADGAFITRSTLGIGEVYYIGGMLMQSSPIVKILQEAYSDLVSPA